MEFGEGSTNTNFKKVDPNDPRERIKIRVGVFFDGTLNNMTNINQRLLASDQKSLTDDERNAADDLKRSADKTMIDEAKKIYEKYGDPGSDNSYEGYYTNIYRLYQYANIKRGKTPGYKEVAKIYIEGPGTEDEGKDDKKGFAFGIGDTGIPAKVESGVSKVIQNITKNLPDHSKIIELLTIDVYGFSRGAACARKFIHDSLFGRRFVFAGGSLGSSNPDTTIRSQLTKLGYTIDAPGPQAGVKICLAGLFDTVSTYGLGVLVDEDDNVDALSLNAVFHAEETFHLTAADEHRYHFSLTDTRSAGSRGKQYFLPGVHSDIGGGYRENGSENQNILGSRGFVDAFTLQACDVSPQEAQADMEYLIDLGWFRHDEVKTKKDTWDDNKKNKIKIDHYYDYIEPHDKVYSVPPQRIERAITSTQRYNLHNDYSVIPLLLMAKTAHEKGVIFASKLKRDEVMSDKMKEVKGKIESYVDKQGNYSSENQDWLLNREAWMKELRHDYFHFSARMKIGHDPRIVDGKRIRKIYHG